MKRKKLLPTIHWVDDSSEIQPKEGHIFLWEKGPYDGTHYKCLGYLAGDEWVGLGPNPYDAVSSLFDFYESCCPPIEVIRPSLCFLPRKR